MVELRSVSKTFGEGEFDVTVLRDINVTIGEGEFVAIMGPSGSGKSTLMHIIGFLDVPTTGQYIFKGDDISKRSPDELAVYRSSQFGFVFQAFNLLPKTTVFENVKMPLMYHPKRKSESEQNAIVERIVARVGLTHRKENLSNQLSGGEQQRVAIARALVNDPGIILADEPTGNLDTASGDQIIRILEDLHSQGKTIILVTHERDIASHARRIISLRDGRVESDTTQSA